MMFPIILLHKNVVIKYWILQTLLDRRAEPKLPTAYFNQSSLIDGGRKSSFKYIFLIFKYPTTINFSQATCLLIHVFKLCGAIFSSYYIASYILRMSSDEEITEDEAVMMKTKQ